MMTQKYSDAMQLLSATARRLGILALALVFCVNAFGLRLHDHFEHPSDSENCAEHFCAAALQAHQHDDCTETDFCEHSHHHSLFLLCDIAPMLPTLSNDLTLISASSLENNDLFSLVPASQLPLKIHCGLFSRCPRNGSGRVCPVTGQQLPLLI